MENKNEFILCKQLKIKTQSENRRNDNQKGRTPMANQNFIFAMKLYDVETLSTQVAWMLWQRTELASRKALPWLWKLTDKLNGTPRASAAELKSRQIRKKMWGGLLLVMGIFLLVPGAMKPQELAGPLVVGLVATLLGLCYLRSSGSKKQKRFEKQAVVLLNSMNEAAENQKLRIIAMNGELVFNETGMEEQKVSYGSMECSLETKDLFGLVYDNQMVLLQKKELLFGTVEDFRKVLEGKTAYLEE